MKRSPRRLLVLAVAMAAAAALAACGDNTTTVPAASAPPAAAPENFSSYAEHAFAQQENSAPLPIPATLVFDVNDDPTAFAALLM